MAIRTNKLNVTEAQAASIETRNPTELEKLETTAAQNAKAEQWDSLEAYIAEKAVQGFKKADRALADAISALALSIALYAFRREKLNLIIDDTVADYPVNNALAYMAMSGYVVYRNGKDLSGNALSDSDDAVKAIVEEKDHSKRLKLATDYVRNFMAPTGKKGKKGEALKAQKLSSHMSDFISTAKAVYGATMNDEKARAILLEIAALPEMKDTAIERWNGYIFGRYGDTMASIKRQLDKELTELNTRLDGENPSSGNESDKGKGKGKDKEPEVTETNVLQFLHDAFGNMDDTKFHDFSRAFSIFADSPSGVVEMLANYLAAFRKLTPVNLLAFNGILAVEADKRAKVVHATVEEPVAPESDVTDGESTPVTETPVITDQNASEAA